MPSKKDPALDGPVPAGVPLFRYKSADRTNRVGVPAKEQSEINKGILIEISTVYKNSEHGKWHYSGLTQWIGIAQLIAISEVKDANQS